MSTIVTQLLISAIQYKLLISVIIVNKIKLVAPPYSRCFIAKELTLDGLGLVLPVYGT